jgi:hypothetical protein
MRSFVDTPTLRSRLADIAWVVTDVDGTLTRGSALDPHVVRKIAELYEAGIDVVLVSGRSAGEVLGLVRYLPGVQRGIAENGLLLLEADRDPAWLTAKPDRGRIKAIAEELNNKHDAALRLAPDDPFRLGDVAYEREGRDKRELKRLEEIVTGEGLFMTWSSVHIHLSQQPPDKGEAVLGLAKRSRLDPRRILTIGDAPNDAGLFVRGRFGISVGTADVQSNCSAFSELPAYVTEFAEGEAFLQVARALLKVRSGSQTNPTV